MPEYTVSGEVNTSRLQKWHCPMLFSYDGHFNLTEKEAVPICTLSDKVMVSWLQKWHRYVLFSYEGLFNLIEKEVEKSLDARIHR